MTQNSRAASQAVHPRLPVTGQWRERPIRLAVLVDTLQQPAWLADVLCRGVREGSIELVGAGVLGGASAAAPGRARSLAEKVYLSLDARRYGRADDPARPVGPETWLHDVAPVQLDGAALEPLDLAGMAEGGEYDRWNADVVWYLGARPLVDPVADLAPMGVWTLDPPAGAVGARAMLDGQVTTETTLRRHATAGAAGVLLARVRTSTQRISATVNRAEHLSHVTVAALGWLRRASRLGPAAVHEAARLAGVPAPVKDNPLSATGAVQLAARTVGRLIRPRLPSRAPGAQWQLAYHFGDGPAAMGAAELAPPSTDFGAFTEIVSPADRYWADPFPVEHGGRHYVFFEEHLRGVDDAHIAVAELDPVRGLVEPQVALQRAHHLSFPSVFRWGDDWYMTPESATTGAVSLYRATRFPDGWEHVADLVTGARFVDPVIAHVGSAWWLFVGVLPPGTLEATALHLYHARTPLGPWVPHLLNPVAVDVRSARPAGRLFARGGQYFRPVQDGAPHYGRAMAIHRIDALTPSVFQETRVARIEPTWRPGLVGTHTLNASGRLTMLDVMARAAPAARRGR